MPTSCTRNLLLGIAVSTLPLSGCDFPSSDPVQQASYEQVLQTGSPRRAADYLRTYPDSYQVRSLLISLPPDVLKRIPRSAVRGIDPWVYSTVPAAIRAILGTDIPVAKPTPYVRKYTG